MRISDWSSDLCSSDLVRVGTAEDRREFLAALQRAVAHSIPKPLAVVLNFPSNPTAEVVDLDFYGEVVEFCRFHGIYIISDLAYAEIYFDGAPPPSVLQIPAARDIAVGFTSLPKRSEASR